MPPLRKTPAAFLSYVHFDDENDNGRITVIRVRLSKEVQAHTGEEFIIFQDRDIRWGENWKRRIEESLDCATLLIPIITPSFLKSAYCLDELQRFLKRERELRRDDLILPLYYIDCPSLNRKSTAGMIADPVLEVISSRQYFDWRNLRFEPMNSPEIAKALAQLATQVRETISSAKPPELISENLQQFDQTSDSAPEGEPAAEKPPLLSGVEFTSAVPENSSRAQEVQIESLEWGKYCSSDDGPALDQAEHGLLGFTSGFPPSLLAICQPDDLWISSEQREEETESLFKHVPWGTAIRPVVNKGKVWSVLYRVGVRPEGGTVLLGRRRRYSLGRYLVDPAGVASPLTLFKAMTPLRGLTKDMASSLTPVRAVHHIPTLEEMAPEPFLKQALTYVISGVSLHIKATETEFFGLVDLIWQALPVQLKPLLSAGWNVSTSIAAKLAIVASTIPNKSCAVYSGGAWSLVQPPATNLTAGQLYTSQYFLKAGNDPSFAQKFRYSSEFLKTKPQPALSSVPSFHDSGVLSLFEGASVFVLETAAARSISTVGDFVAVKASKS